MLKTKPAWKTSSIDDKAIGKKGASCRRLEDECIGKRFRENSKIVPGSSFRGMTLLGSEFGKCSEHNGIPRTVFPVGNGGLADLLETVEGILEGILDEKFGM